MPGLFAGLPLSVGGCFVGGRFISTLTAGRRVREFIKSTFQLAHLISV